jgi:hypothetical protein
MTLSRRTPSRFSRRAIVASGLAGAAALPLAPLGRAGFSFAMPAVVAAPRRQSGSAELADWKTWILTSPDELRPTAPGAPTETEIDEVVDALAAPSEEMTAAIRAWGTRPATIPWTALANAAFGEFRVSGFRQSRNLALVHTAMHDAAVAAWDAQLAYDRPSRAATDKRITAPAGVDVAAPTFPSQEAAMAAAAATVLTYLLPDAEAGRFDALAEEAAMSRVWSGAAFPSDVEAGLALGRAVGELAVKRGQGDRSDAVFDPGEMPSGPGFWVPTPPALADPLEPLGGGWQTWVLERSDQFRPAPPPEYGTSAWRSELLAVQEMVRSRTLAQKSDAMWWQSVYQQILYDWTAELLTRHGLDTVHALRVLAYQSVAIADALVAIWDAKYTWWTARPITEDPNIVTAFPTPPYPGYPSGYSGAIGASSQMVGLFFPDAAEELDELAWRAVRSRAWAGIHIPLDNEVGFTVGRRVGRLAGLRASDEGAIPA